MRKFHAAQKRAWPYVRDTQHPALFMEMRLGKTLLTIRRVQLYGRGPTLVVAPNSALTAWRHELELEGLTYTDLQGTRKQRLFELANLHIGWLLINKEGYRAIPEIAKVNWHTVILDESTFIKNPKVQVTKFYLKHFRHVQHRWILTGNPNPNSDLDFWSQLAFLDNKAFGYYSFWDFRAKAFEPEEYGYDWQPKFGTPTMIKNFLAHRAFILRRKDVDADVPKSIVLRSTELPPKLRKAYDTLESLFILDYNGEEIASTKYTIDKYRLARQLCGGFIDGELIWPGKLNDLVQLLTGELANEKVVIWAQYLQEIAAIEEAVTAAGICCDSITGKVKPAARDNILRAFNDKTNWTSQVLILQPTIARTGLDLSVADTSIYYGPPFGVETWVQSQDRIVKIGKKHALLIILCARDTIEDAYLEALRGRTLTQRKVLDRALAIRRRFLCPA